MVVFALLQREIQKVNPHYVCRYTTIATGLLLKEDADRVDLGTPEIIALMEFSIPLLSIAYAHIITGII